MPSQCTPGQYYLVTCSRCDCQDAQRHLGQPCKQQLAVRLHCELVKAQNSRRARSAFEPHVSASGETIHLPRRTESADALWKRFEGDPTGDKCVAKVDRLERLGHVATVATKPRIEAADGNVAWRHQSAGGAYVLKASAQIVDLVPNA